MIAKFDIFNKHKLDNPKRRQLLPPYAILKNMGLKEGETAADIGCGIGYFSIPAAEIAGLNGLIYALDIRTEMIEEVKKRTAENGIPNLKTIVTDEYDFKLENDSVSFAFNCLVLHEVKNKQRFLNENKRIIGPGGKLVIIEWIKKDSDWGPLADHRLDGDYVRKLVSECGFREVDLVEINQYFYAVLANK